MDEGEFGGLLSSLLRSVHRINTGELPGLVHGAARSLGLLDAVIFLADLQEVRLVPLTADDLRTPAPTEGPRPGLPVDGTLAGWAYRTGSLQLTSGSELIMWLPLVDGVERIGVLRLTAPALDASTLEQCTVLASLVAHLVVSKAAFSDTIQRTVRSNPMTIQAELAWAFMPPRTIGTPSVTSSAVLEPAYAIGGDAFDHSLTLRTLHVTVIDAMGHDLASGLSAAVALAGCRSTRRGGGDLADISAAVDDALNRWLPDRLLTAVFADLDLETGALTWVNCGHPPPLLIRRHRVVPDALLRHAQLPLGISSHHTPRVPSVIQHAQLEPGDRVLIHTDGVTDARAASGQRFGEERLIDTVVRATAAGEASPEALRRLVRTILDHHQGRLTDDATILLAEWHPPAPAPHTA
ncbi:PP2C family protein-serine/threonine phosphatase [Streptomyces sp. NPDC060048]|uniref:PP2C family protein-serine/threonine phosphatase n=1 Tax=unclassified Streptomyces TaxID=2593676 RepID=UPI0036A0468B